MIDLYTFGTPNGRKASIMLEEVSLPYTTHKFHIGQNDQFAPAFLKISPNNKISAIIDNDVDGEPISVFETGAILVYLAKKTHSPLLPTAAPGAVGRDAMADVENGRAGPHVRASQLVHRESSGQRTGHRTLRQRSHPLAWRARPQSGGSGIHGW
ncbi:MAG: glutathione S-transferase N-terminal domain-containing protein [Alphaproteobacteria bacterium]